MVWLVGWLCGCLPCALCLALSAGCAGGWLGGGGGAGVLLVPFAFYPLSYLGGKNPRMHPSEDADSTSWGKGMSIIKVIIILIISREADKIRKARPSHILFFKSYHILF